MQGLADAFATFSHEQPQGTTRHLGMRSGSCLKSDYWRRLRQVLMHSVAMSRRQTPRFIPAVLIHSYEPQVKFLVAPHAANKKYVRRDSHCTQDFCTLRQGKCQMAQPAESCNQYCRSGLQVKCLVAHPAAGNSSAW